jgi:ribonucleoside-diphosphate reductase alpha chain
MDRSAAELSRTLWETKYRLVEDGLAEQSVEDSWSRISAAVAEAEGGEAQAWRPRFEAALKDFRFLPGGRIQASAGVRREATLFNCFVMGPIADANAEAALEESAVTLRFGGGVGCDFSSLAPRGAGLAGTGAPARGPLAHMQAWDAMCGEIVSVGFRRGAMIGVLRCDHPDIEAFVQAKAAGGQLRRFNLSVLTTDAFMGAVRSDADWPLVFPSAALTGEGETLMRAWPGSRRPVPCRVFGHVRARALWERILRAAYAAAEPGVLFIDRINAQNNLAYCEQIIAANPCGEIPLPAYGACDLGSLNLTRFVLAPFTPQARLDLGALATTARTAVRFLDDVIEVSRFPLPQQAAAVRAARRIGLGVTGLADALLMCGLGYGDPAALALAGSAMRTIRDAAYDASADLAQEKGAFPAYRREPYLDAPFVRRLPPPLRDKIAEAGVRNSHLLAIAPTGSISLLAGNVSSGLEPIFAPAWRRAVATPDGPRHFELCDYAVAQWRSLKGPGAGLPPGFAAAADLPIRAHLDMQAALQPYIDNAISKTVTVAEACPFDAFRQVYEQAYDLGLKGCTAFRPNAATGSVLECASPSGQAG